MVRGQATKSSEPLAIQVHPTPEYSSRQPEHDHLPSCPMRGLFVGPSGSGKTVALVDLLVRLYRGCFQRIYVFSPIVDLDSAWLPVKRYSEHELGVDPQKEQCFYSRWDPAAIKAIVDQQMRVTEHSKRRGMKVLYGICIVIDDFADDPRIVHSQSGAAAGGSMLNTLFIRGRHSQISTIVSTQKLRLISSTMRVNTQFLCVWRLRSALELESLLEEVSALHDKKTLLAMYEHATSQPYGFWYVNLTRHPAEMFFVGFHSQMRASNKAC